MIKRLLSICLIAMLLGSGASAAPQRELLLLTEYRQLGWGERLQLGALDTEGGLWSLELTDGSEVPYAYSELVAWAESCDAEQVGSIPASRLQDLLSLVDTADAERPDSRSAADDAGTQTSLAIRRDRNGTVEIIVLGTSGDDVSENTDPGARALYRFLRDTFPEVTDFRNDPDLSPAGFRPIGLAEFMGYDPDTLTGLTVTAFYNDCESGARPTTPTLTLDTLLSMTVTGKRNSLFTTGNTITYYLVDAQEETVAAFEFYNDLLVARDGMYSVSHP